MAVRVPATDPLLEFLSGKRIHKRYDVSMPVTIGGATGRFGARATDLSIGGTQLLITEKALNEVRGEATDMLGIVSACLADGFDVHFDKRGLVLEAELVRLSVPAGQPGVLLAGCRFVEELSCAQQVKLGIKSEDEAEAVGSSAEAPLEATPFVALEGRSLSILLYGQEDDVSGPRYVGRVTGFDKKRCTLDIAGTDPRELREALGQGTFEIAIARLGGGMWTTHARLHRVEFDDHCDGGVAVALQMDAALPRPMRRAFRRRTA